MPDIYSILTVVAESPVTDAVLAAIAIASFVYAIYCRHSPGEKVELRYHISSLTLADVKAIPMEEDFAFYHKGKPIERCVATVVSIWNNGNKTLEASDIAPKSQLAFVCKDEDAEILDARILDVTKEEADVCLFTIDKRKRVMLFDYLAAQDGAKVLLLHTGSKESIAVGGALKNGREIKPIYQPGENNSILSSKAGLRFAVFAFLTLICLASWAVTAIYFLASAGVVPIDVLYFVGQSAEQLRGHAMVMDLMFAVMSAVTTLAAVSFFRKARRSGIPQAIR